MSGQGYETGLYANTLLCYRDFIESFSRLNCSQYSSDNNRWFYAKSYGPWIRDLQFKLDFERQIFEKFNHGNFICSQRVFARNLLSLSHRRSIQIPFCRRCLTWDMNLCLTSNEPTHYQLDYGDYIWSQCFTFNSVIISLWV